MCICTYVYLHTNGNFLRNTKYIGMHVKTAKHSNVFTE